MTVRGLAVVGLVLGLFYLVIFALAVVSYVFSSLSLYTLAKRRGIPNPGLAWAPVGNVWILGSLADQYMGYAEKRVTKYRKILLGLSIAVCAVAVLSTGLGLSMGLSIRSYGGFRMADLGSLIGIYLIIWTIAIVLAVFEYIALYRLFQSCRPRNATLFLVLSILFGITMPFFLFAIRNKDEGMYPRC